MALAVAILVTGPARPAAGATPPDGTYRGAVVGGGLSRPVAGLAVTPSGNGYWLVASDGGIFAFGDAVFRGSTGATRLNQPIVGMAATPSGNGYWLVASDGGIFAFGAVFHGAMGGRCLPDRVVGLATSVKGEGYRMAGRDGLVYAFPGGASYAFESERPGCQPVRWNPCAPVPYVVNPAGGPPNALALAQAAVEQAARATGLDLRFQGLTDEPASATRAVVQGRYGSRFAPLLVAWAGPDQIGPAAGFGGIATLGTRTAPEQVITGFAYVASQLARPGRPASDALQTGVLLHELGHALGLDHADDTLQVMNSVGDSGQPLTEYLTGDLAGLDRVGRRAGCLAPIA